MPHTTTRGSLGPMDPLEAISGEPRKSGAEETAAPAAAHWLTNPTTHDGTPDPDSEAAQYAHLIALGKAIAADDAATWTRNDPRPKA